MSNIVEIIRNETKGCLSNCALVLGKSRLSYQELFERVDSYAVKLQNNGVEKFQRVAFLCEDNIDYVAMSLAVLSIGAVIVPVSLNFSFDELDKTFTRIQPHFFVFDNNIFTKPDSHFLTNKFSLFKCNLETSELSKEYCDIGPAFIRFSSGTTGTSKGVLLSHKSIIERTNAANKGLKINSNDKIIWVLSMSFHFVVSILLFLRKGATIILCVEDFPNLLCSSLNSEKPTFIYASPFHYNIMATSLFLSPTAFSKIRIAISTAIGLPEKIAEKFYKKFSISLAQAYGIIEVGLPFINFDVINNGKMSVGKALQDYKLFIKNPDKNNVGGVLVAGPGMFDAYFSPWQKREDIAVQGWFDTGDLGYVDNMGNLFIVGRKKNVINFIGLKIFPYEVEQVIDTYPDVKESLVYGEEHSDYGQLPSVKIVLQNKKNWSLAAFKNFCYANLASFKVPKKIEVVEFLEKTQSGKIMRKSGKINK